MFEKLIGYNVQGSKITEVKGKKKILPELLIMFISALLGFMFALNMYMLREMQKYKNEHLKIREIVFAFQDIVAESGHWPAGLEPIVRNGDKNE
jgi:hypothetical protein